MKTVGIIGFGSFGTFLAEKLDPLCRVIGYSRSGKAGKWSAKLEEVAAADYLIIAIPLDAYDATLRTLRSIIGTQTTIVDVCSVKLEPIEQIKKILPGQKIVSTHPLFGPESAGDSLAAHTIVLCKEQSDGEPFGRVRQLCIKLELEVVEMTAEEHDREMATVHGLTFFIAHSLKDMGLHAQKLATPSFKKLLSLAELEKHHSQELFETIQRGNPYSKQVRQSFVSKINDLSRKLEKEQTDERV